MDTKWMGTCRCGARWAHVAGALALLLAGPAGAATSHKPLFVVSNWGNGGGSIPTNLATALDGPTVVKCKKTNGCTILVQSTVAIFQTTNAVHWSVCATVDGLNANPACPNQDTNVGNLIGSWRQNLTVTEGSHTVQTFVTQSGTATLGSWEVDYTVTSP